MIVEMQEFMSEKSQALADQAQKFRKNPELYIRKALAGSAESLKTLKSPIRVMAHSGVKFTVVSQTAVQNLIELESEAITSALTAAAKRCERAAQAENVVDLVLDQADMFAATRDRVVDEATRAVDIFKVTGRDLRGVARHAYDVVVKATEEKAPEVKRAKRKVKRAVRKTTARARKAAA